MSLPVPSSVDVDLPSTYDEALSSLALSSDETRDVTRLAVGITVIMVLFAVAGVVLWVETGDAATGVAALLEFLLAPVFLHARRLLLAGRSQRGAGLMVTSILVAVMIMAGLPPPVPALAAAPILAIAFSLSFFNGPRLSVALIAATVVSVVTATLIEFVPSSPDLPPEAAAGMRIISFGVMVGLTALVLARHRLRLELALESARSASAAMRDSEGRYRSVVEGVREVIFRFDALGQWRLLNHAWEEMTGIPVAESLGRPVLDFVHPDDRASVADLARPVMIGELHEFRHELRLVGRDGADIWVEARARPLLDGAGAVGGMSGTLTDITVRRVLEERLVRQAFHDDLTGLANRALLMDRVEHALSRRTPVNRLVGLLFLDLDRFKTVNDSLGHTVGDELLVAIARRLHAVLRPEDTIARLGGDEFAILVDEVNSPKEVVNLAERISAAFGTPFKIGEREISIRCSIGIVLASGGHRTADDLLRDADVAMYRAKVSGRGSYALFEPSMQAEVAARLEMESNLRAAIEHERLTLAYQPIVDLRDGRIVAVEALARWTHPVRGIIPPSVFIPIAEESGLILPLGAWVLRRACLDLASLRAAGGAATRLRLSVNLSPRQLGDRTIVDEVLGALTDAGVPPQALDIEITESLVLDCGEAGLGYLRELRAAGCGVSFDDFGTGFSSLGNLRSLPIDELKIDISFVSAMLASPIEAAIVEAVVSLGVALDVAVVAEGVEDAETAARLLELGCPFGQGYYFGRPMPLDALAMRLSDPITPRAAA